MATSNALMTVWPTTTLSSRAERLGTQAVRNVRRAAHVHQFNADSMDWAMLARVYQKAVGAASWWRIGLSAIVQVAGAVAYMTALGAVSLYAQRHWTTEPVRIPFSPGLLGVAEVLAFTIVIVVAWIGIMCWPVALIAVHVRRIARKTPTWTQRPVPPALAIAETCGEFLSAPGDEQAPLLKRLDEQLEVLLAELWRATGNGMGLTRHPAHRQNITRHLRRVDAALRATQGSLLSDPDAARTLGRQSLTIANRLAAPRITQLLDEGDLPAEADQDQCEGRRLAVITVLGLGISSVVVYGLLQLHVLSEALASWVFGAAFVSVFLATFGQRSSARPLAVLRQRIAALGTPADPPAPDTPAQTGGNEPPRE